MPENKRTRTSRRAERLRRQRRARRMRIALIALAAALIVALSAWLITRKPSPRDDSASEPQATVEPMPETHYTPDPTAVPTPEPTPEPTRTPQPTPEGMPNVVSFYTPKDKSYSPRVRMGDTFSARWKKGEDIGSFEVIPSDRDELPGSFFGDIFGAAWTAFPGSAGCKIGYTLRYTLEDGQEIQYTMLSPQHIEHTEYIECWLYDDYHREPHQFYSHIKKMGANTLMTSIKLTCGSRIDQVKDIWLTAFVCASLDDFDADRNYIGDVSCTIHITRK